MSALSKKDPDQLIMTANRLKDGVVVYFTGNNWSENIHDAVSSLDGEFLTKVAQRTIANENFISVELIKVDQLKSVLAPVTMREKIRSRGPTINYSKINYVTIRDENVSV